MADQDLSDSLKQLLNSLNNMEIKLAQYSQRLVQAEDWLRMSLNTRDDRVATTATLVSRLDEMKRRIEGLESNDKNLDNRFFQVWIGLFFALVGFILNFVKVR